MSCFPRYLKTCSKGNCIIDGKKPVMALPAAATTHLSKKRVARDETSVTVMRLRVLKKVILTWM